jgi:ABC-2 type transport system permease protein
MKADARTAFSALPGGRLQGRIDCYTRLMIAGFRRHATYRQAVLAGLVTNAIFALIRVAILLAVVSDRGSVAGYDAADVVGYVWLGQGLYTVVLLWGDSELADRIRSGDVVIDLSRPWHLQLALLAQDLGRAAFAVPTRLVPPMVIATLLFPLRWPTRPLTWLLFTLSVLLAVVVSFAMRFIVNLATFWMMEIRGLGVFYGVTGGVLAGLTLPLAFFPDWIRPVLWCTPFPSMLQAPIDVFTGHGSPLMLLGIQTFMALALLVLGRLLLVRAERRLVVQGG